MGSGSIPGLSFGVFTSDITPSICCVEDALYVAGGSDESASPRASLQLACVQLAGRIFVIVGRIEGGFDNFRAEVISYDPRTDRWRSESPLPRENY